MIDSPIFDIFDEQKLRGSFKDEKFFNDVEMYRKKYFTDTSILNAYFKQRSFNKLKELKLVRHICIIFQAHLQGYLGVQWERLFAIKKDDNFDKIVSIRYEYLKSRWPHICQEWDKKAQEQNDKSYGIIYSPNYPYSEKPLFEWFSGEHLGDIFTQNEDFFEKAEEDHEKYFKNINFVDTYINPRNYTINEKKTLIKDIFLISLAQKEGYIDVQWERLFKLKKDESLQEIVNMRSKMIRDRLPELTKEWDEFAEKIINVRIPQNER